MKNFLRVFEFAWPYRHRLLLSMLFAFGLAGLWSVAITLTQPVMVVLTKDQTLHEYVDLEIAKTEHQIEEQSRRLDELEASKPDGAKSRRSARLHRKASSAEWSLYGLNTIRQYILPYVPQDRFETLAVIFAVLLCATLMRGTCRFVQEVLVGSVVQLVLVDIRKRCFRRILQMDYQTVSRDGTSDLMSRFTHDTAIIGNGLTVVAVKLIREPLKAIGCIVGAFMVNWQLTLMCLIFVPPAGILLSKIGRKLKNASRRMLEAMSRIYKVLEETLNSMKVVIAFGGARQHRQQFHRENKEYYKKMMKIVKLDALTSPSIEMLGMMAIFMVVLPGAYLACRSTRTIWGITLASQEVSFPGLMLLYGFLIATVDPLRKLSSVYSVLKRAGAASDRVFELIEREPTMQAETSGCGLARHRQSIEFENINFTYAGDESSLSARGPALEDVSLKIQAGEFVAIVGENGSGKSTLVNLLPRFYDPDRGTIRIDGVNVRDVAPRQLRAQMGIVTQETMLFDDTIENNIRYGNRLASDAELAESLTQADVDQLINDLPDGLQTHVGVRGQKLSGGQRQRLSLARALIRDPSILILDEATSAVDAQSEVLLYKALQKSSANRTTLLVTHFVSAQLLEMISRIAVMDRGRLIAVGTHEELLKTCPLYSRLVHARSDVRAA